MKYKFMNILSNLFLFVFVLSLKVSAIADQKEEKNSSNRNISGEEASSERNKKIQEEKNGDKNNVYSFRPLLIQGKKRLIQKTKDMKVESENIVDSELFFVDIDFKERIFESESSLK